MGAKWGITRMGLPLLIMHGAIVRYLWWEARAHSHLLRGVWPYFKPPIWLHRVLLQRGWDSGEGISLGMAALGWTMKRASLASLCRLQGIDARRREVALHEHVNYSLY